MNAQTDDNNRTAVAGPVERQVRPHRDECAAFPVLPPCDMEGASANGYPCPESGMALRDYFAAAAMGGMCAAFPNVAKADMRSFVRDVPMTAYEIADAMMAAREA